MIKHGEAHLRLSAQLLRGRRWDANVASELLVLQVGPFDGQGSGVSGASREVLRIGFALTMGQHVDQRHHARVVGRSQEAFECAPALLDHIVQQRDGDQTFFSASTNNVCDSSGVRDLQAAELGARVTEKFYGQLIGGGGIEALV